MVVLAHHRRRRGRVVCRLKDQIAQQLLEEERPLAQHTSDQPLQPSRVAEIASQRLRGSGHPSLSRVECTWQHGVLRLTGRVSSYHLKQVAQAILLATAGIERVHNQLEVAPLS